MNALSQIVTQQITGSAVSSIAKRLGISESTANSAVQLGIPLILSALARNAAQPEGAQQLHQAVSNHDGSIFDNLSGFLGNPQSANGAGILGHIFGGQQPAIANSLAGATGMNQGSASSLLETLAPLVMGAVGKAQQQQGLDASGLSNLLTTQNQEAQANAPDLMGAVGSMLDQNKDGSVIDDIKRLAAGFFK